MLQMFLQKCIYKNYKNFKDNPSSKGFFQLNFIWYQASDSVAVGTEKPSYQQSGIQSYRNYISRPK